MMNDGLDLLIPNLVRIEMWSCNRSKVLQPFGQLPSLKYLYLQFLDAVESMKDCPFSARPFFPSLKTLKIYNMPNLKGWGMRVDVTKIVAEQAPSYPHLRSYTLQTSLRSYAHN